MFSSLSALNQAFLSALADSGFHGEFSTAEAQRSVYATDNSVYERTPQAVIWPRSTADVQAVLALAAREEFRQIVITARGGGTGTNGQSLTDGIVLDVSRFMNDILEIDVQHRRVRVQAGVVKDQLNRALKPYGLFFAPELSTSNRATIGGMINTDACGQGSLRYGKTHDHVLGLRTVLLGGEVLDSAALPRHDWQARIADKSPPQQALYAQIFRLAADNQDKIRRSFPPLTRALTGYDLPHVLDEQSFNINSILCGSEGSLGIICEAELNVLPIPQHRALINIGYADFQSALEDANALMSQSPLSIETVDSKVLALAQQDIVWESVARFFPAAEDAPVQGINLLEIDAADADALATHLSAILAHLQSDNSVTRLTCTVARGEAEIEAVYHMRKRAVGLLGNVQGEQRPLPFVEDTAVPPEHLAAYIKAFRQVLDDKGLAYGMFGHVDAGVLHVRPQLDMKVEGMKDSLREITEAVVALTHRYGGVLWGEHGKGLRSEYAPTFFGDCWDLICRIKSAFDPHNQLNPGKIAVPYAGDAELTPLTAVPMRGDFDRRIDKQDWQNFGNTLQCNGNGACFNFAFDDPMCPSWKVTRDRQHSPKGRAMLLKEWLRRKADSNLTSEFEQEVYQALHGCLSCKSCAGQCPVKVDIPDGKSRFLAEYHRRHRRPLRDYLIGYLEYLIPHLVKIAPLYNLMQNNRLMRGINRKFLRLSDAPLFHPQARADLAAYGVQMLRKGETPPKQDNAVIVLQDAFTRYFDTPVFLDWLRLLQTLGIKTYLLPYFPNGKPLHVHGFLAHFHKLRRHNEQLLAAAAESGLPIIGLDPAMTLVFRQEYLKDTPQQPGRRILLPQEWLRDDYLPRHVPLDKPSDKQGTTYYFAAHCTEKTQLPSSNKDWQRIFQHFGLDLQPVAVGCCGMAGTFGHESEHQAQSAQLFDMSWQAPVAQYGEQLLATGYSCRSQSKRMSGTVLQHPLQALLKRLDEAANREIVA